MMVMSINDLVALRQQKKNYFVCSYDCVFTKQFFFFGRFFFLLSSHVDKVLRWSNNQPVDVCIKQQLIATINNQELLYNRREQK